MIISLVEFLRETILPIGAPGIFLAAVLEEVVVPIPSAAVLLTSGFLFLTGYDGAALIARGVLTVAIPAALGTALGSLVVYGATYRLGKPFIDRFGRHLSISWEDVEAVQARYFTGYADELVLAGLRAVPVIPSVALSAAAGVLRMPVVSYLVATFAGTIPRALILASIGAFAGDLYVRYEPVIDRAENVVFLGAGATLILGLLWLRARKKV